MEYTLKPLNEMKAGKLVSKKSDLEVCLGPNAIYRLDGSAARGCTLQVLEGSLWLTRQNDPRDYELHAGERYTVDAPGLVLIEGMPSGKFRMTPPGRAE